MFETETVLDMIVSKSHNAFVSGRLILDLVLIVNECVDSCVRSKISSVICNLDIEKKYNHVNCEALIYLLGRMSFGDRLREWTRTCISTVQFLGLINGSPTRFFSSLRGLTKGDPPSPMLFLLMMEEFNKMFKRMEAAWSYRRL